MSKKHWLLLLLIANVFYLLSQVQELWLAVVLILTNAGLSYWYLSIPSDKPYAYDIYQIGVDHGAGMERFNNRMQNEMLPFKAKGEVKRGQGVCPSKPSKKTKKSTKKRK